MPITSEMVNKALSKMKPGKAAGPSGIVVEMIEAAGGDGVTLLRDLASAIVRNGKVPPTGKRALSSVSTRARVTL